VGLFHSTGGFFFFKKKKPERDKPNVQVGLGAILESEGKFGWY
jgi:hypothetical protein